MNMISIAIQDNSTIKETGHYRLYRAGGSFRVNCKHRDCVPRGRVISCRDANYLAQLSTKPDANGHSTFDSGCVEAGVGVFRKEAA